VLCIYREMKILRATAWKTSPIQAIANTASDPPPSLGVHAAFAPDQEYKHHGTLSLPITDTAKSMTGSRDRYGSRDFIHFSGGPPKLARPSMIKVILDNSAYNSKEHAELAKQPARHSSSLSRPSTVRG
jgi:hypothetical protein